MLYRECEVRVCQARHLTARNGAEYANKRDKRPQVTAMCVQVLITHDGRHVPTELCRNIESPYWQKIASFPLVLRDSVEEPEGISEESSGMKRHMEVEHENKEEQVMQSLNPFAKNFVPPESMPTQPAPPPSPPPRPVMVDGPLRTSVVVHFHVLSDNLISRELIGDVAVDLVPILETADKKMSVLATDRLGHVEENVQLAGLRADATIATDTWVPLRQTNGELRIQMLIKPESDGRASSAGFLTRPQGFLLPTAGEVQPIIPRVLSSANFRSPSKAFGADHPRALQPRRNSDEEIPGHAQNVSQDIRRRQGASPYSTNMSGRTAGEPPPDRASFGYLKYAPIGLWPEFDMMAREGMVKVSVPASHGSLDKRLLEVQEQYDFSAARGYREGTPDQDAGEGMKAIARETDRVPEWPTGIFDAVQLRRDMQFAALRDKRQCVAWAEKLGSSSGLQEALRNPQPFGVLRRKCPGRGTNQGAAVSNDGVATSTLFQQTGRELEDLVRQGMPKSLQQQMATTVDREGERDRGVGGAFEGDEAEPSFLEGVSTAVPRVEVVRVTGRLCCAEYHVQVRREVSGDSWFVVRRYSDFRQLYDNLPRPFAAITPPLPPKSWRSLSFLSMTPITMESNVSRPFLCSCGASGGERSWYPGVIAYPQWEFLEDRRVALEVALRRLAINAVRADSTVQADVRAFLGFPPCPGRGLLAGVDAEVARHLARVPPQLELSLPERGPRPVSLLNNLRVTMWMLLSGAAYKSSVTEDREQYPALVSVGDEQEWCRQGGQAAAYRKAAAVFRTIDGDVNRTNVRDSDERERIRRVLRAFALKNPSTGYCQGMNSVALFLLRTADGREDLCFWLLDALGVTVMPGHWKGLSHISSTNGGVTLRILMDEHLPQLLEHLDSRGLPPEILACDFFLSLGCRALPPLSVLRVLDILFWEGGETLLYVALAVLHLAQDELLGVQGAAATSDCLAKCTTSMNDADSIIDLAEAAMEKHMYPEDLKRRHRQKE